MNNWFDYYKNKIVDLIGTEGITTIAWSEFHNLLVVKIEMVSDVCVLR